MERRKGSNKVLYKDASGPKSKTYLFYNVFDRKGFPFIYI